MNCFTYTSAGETLAGITINDTNQKTCAIKLNVPKEWNVDDVIHKIQSRLYADIFLYCHTELITGNSVNSVFPPGCVLIRCVDIFDVDNYKNSCYELNLSPEHIDYVLFEDSALFDRTRNKFIVNVDGEARVQDNAPIVSWEDRLPEDKDERDYDLLL